MVFESDGVHVGDADNTEEVIVTHNTSYLLSIRRGCFVQSEDGGGGFQPDLDNLVEDDVQEGFSSGDDDTDDAGESARGRRAWWRVSFHACIAAVQLPLEENGGPPEEKGAAAEGKAA